MKGKLIALGLAVFGMATIGASQLTVQAGVDNGRDCDQFAIIYCGAMNKSELLAEYDSNGKSDKNTSTKENADIKKVFSAMGISRADLTGSFEQGTVYQDGRVVVGGKTVATGAQMAARGLGGTAIAGTSASKVSVSKMASAQSAFVYMKDGTFQFAVMKPCANPVTATPPPTPPAPTPKTECKALTPEKLGDSGSRYRYQAEATVSGGAKVKSFRFVTTKNGEQVDSKTVTTEALKASYTFDAKDVPGKYTVKLTVGTSEGPRSGPACEKSFEVKQPPKPNTPGVSIEKYVDTDKKYKRVGVNVEYSYRIIVKNTGDTDLTKVKVTDTPQDGITLISVEPPRGTVTEDSWMYTIPNLREGETRTFTLKAKVPVYLAGKLTNTVCVDAPQVPGNPDECDEADVEVPPTPVPGKIEVCVLADKTIAQISEDEFDESLHSRNLADCDEEEIPEELPETGPEKTILSVVGAMSLVGSAAYYVASRRQI